MQHRIGTVESAAGYELKLWSAAVGAGIASVALDRFALHALLRHVPFRTIVEALVVSGIFGVLYFAIAFVLGVHEVKATLGRFVRR
jgi:hypothetical protein